MLTSSAPRIQSVHPNGVSHHLMCKFHPELKSWNQFPAFAEVPICQFRVHLSHSQVPCKVSIGPELSCPCPLNLNSSMSSIFVIIYLVAVAEVQAKCLEILEYPDEGLTIPPLVFPPSIRSVQLFECHPGGHNLHDILWFL